MADRGETFSPAMVLAISAGRKTVTRRLATKSALAAKGATGDRIYVREHWKTLAMNDKHSPRELMRIWEKSIYGRANACPVQTLVDGWFQGQWPDPHERTGGWAPGRHRQAMHMPRAISRCTLFVTDVRVERLQRITPESAIAEGIYPVGDGKWAPLAMAEARVYRSPVEAYRDLWDSLHGEVGTTWHDNPDVIVTTFAPVWSNIDAIELGRTLD